MLGVAGALTHHRGGRTTVSEMQPDQILNGLSMVVPLLPLDRFLSLFGLREVLEGHCAAQSAARMTEDEAEALYELAFRLSRKEPGREAQLLDSEFHARLVAGAGDPMISSLLESLRIRGREFKIYEDQAHSSLKNVSDDAHLGIAKAIRGRDPEAARFLAMAHVRTTRAWLEKFRPNPQLFSADGQEA